MTLTRRLLSPDRSSWRKSGEILLVKRFAGLLAAFALVLVEIISAEPTESSRAKVTSRFHGWGRNIQFSPKGLSQQIYTTLRSCERRASASSVPLGVSP